MKTVVDIDAGMLKDIETEPVQTMPKPKALRVLRLVLPKARRSAP